MLRNLFQALFGSFFRYSDKELQQFEAAVEKERLVILNKERIERELIQRMIYEALAIADGSYITKSNLPEPVIPERRKEKR